MVVPWNSSFDASVWLHFGILVSGDTLPDGTSKGQHDSVDFKPLSRAESCLGPEKSAANPEGVGLRFLVPMHHHVAFDSVDSTLEEAHGMAFGFGPATLGLKRGFADAKMNTGWLILGFGWVWIWLLVKYGFRQKLFQCMLGALDVFSCRVNLCVS